jgi:hypothetical protein
LLLPYAQHTGQNVKRVALGAEGPVLDHYSAAAARSHLRHVGDRLLEAVPAHLIGSVFCDSLEVYGSDWTPALTLRRGVPGVGRRARPAVSDQSYGTPPGLISSYRRADLFDGEGWASRAV